MGRAGQHVALNTSTKTSADTSPELLGRFSKQPLGRIDRRAPAPTLLPSHGRLSVSWVSRSTVHQLFKPPPFSFPAQHFQSTCAGQSVQGGRCPEDSCGHFRGSSLSKTSESCLVSMVTGPVTQHSRRGLTFCFYKSILKLTSKFAEELKQSDCLFLNLK